MFSEDNYRDLFGEWKEYLELHFEDESLARQFAETFKDETEEKFGEVMEEALRYTSYPKITGIRERNGEYYTRIDANGIEFTKHLSRSKLNLY